MNRRDEEWAADFRGAAMSMKRSYSTAGALLLLLSLVSVAQEEKRFIGRLTFKDAKVSALAITSESKHVLWGFTTGTLSIVEPKPNKTVVIEAFPAHSKTISCAAFSPDNKWLASGSVDGTVKLWETYVIARWQDDCQNRKEGAAKPPFPQAKKMITNSAPVNDLSFSPDGKRLATCGATGNTRVWNIELNMPKVLFTFPGHKGGTNAVAFSPDGTQIATAGGDKTAKIWKAATATKPEFTLTGHDGPVLTLAFSPDGKRLATGSGVARKSGQILVWDVEKGKEEFKISDFIDDAVTTLCFHPTLPRLASGSRDKKIRVYNLATKKPAYIDEHANGLIKVQITGDGKRLGSICPDEAKLWLGSPKVAE
jgi:WD40 repeat protein